MSDTEKKETHDSFGLLSFSRVNHSSGRLNLFGSTIAHGNTIVMRVSQAEKHRSLNRNWYFSKDTILEVEMSPTQFSDAVTSFNMGSGVPVTIRRLNGKGIENPPCTDIKKEFEEEFKGTVKKAYETSEEALKKIKNILSQKSVKKSELKEVETLLIHIQHGITSNQDFVYRQFNEQIDRSVVEAKGEIEAYIEDKIRSTGVESLNQQFSTNNLLEGKIEEPGDDCSV